MQKMAVPPFYSKVVSIAIVKLQKSMLLEIITAGISMMLPVNLALQPMTVNIKAQLLW